MSLNVVMTMINAIYERRREMSILSSVGLNPTHITFLFGAEALVIGLVGGGMGYMLGLSLYRVMSLLSMNVAVRQKISFSWSLASIGIAVVAVLVGAIVALRSSTHIVPSFLRRWTREEKSFREGGGFRIPVRIHEGEVDSLFNYIKLGLQRRIQKMYTVSPVLLAKLAKDYMEKTSESHIEGVDFKYRLGEAFPIGSFPFKLIAERKIGEDTYTLRVSSESENPKHVLKLVSFIRMLVVEWGASGR